MTKFNEILSILNSPHSQSGSRISAKLLLIADATGKSFTNDQLSKATGLSVNTICSILAGIHQNDNDYVILENYIDDYLKNK